MNILALMRSCHILLTYISGIGALHILPLYPLSVGVFSSHRWYLFPLLGTAREIAQKLHVVTDIVQQERASSVEYLQCLQNTVTGHRCWRIC